MFCSLNFLLFVLYYQKPSCNLANSALDIPLKISKTFTKPRPRDFEDDFTFYPDNGESDEELFERHKKEIVYMKRKNFAVRRVNMKNLLVTKKMRGILDSKSFREYVENRPENDEDFRPWIKVLEIFNNFCNTSDFWKTPFYVNI